MKPWTKAHKETGPKLWGEQQRARVLLYIDSYITNNGYSPTMREIGASIGVTSSSTIYAHLERLRDEGKLTWIEGSFRTLRLVKADA